MFWVCICIMKDHMGESVSMSMFWCSYPDHPGILTSAWLVCFDRCRSLRMGKIGRMKKHSHWKYSKSAKNENRQVQSSTSISFPFKYLFSLRNVPPAVTNQPSINNYLSVFSSLSRDLVFNNKWNLIEHSDLFLMLCTFTQAAVPVPEKTIYI